MKILSILGLDQASKDKNAQKRLGNAMLKEQDALIHTLQGEYDTLEVKRDDLESPDNTVDPKTWVREYQETEVAMELAKKKLEIAKRTKKQWFTDEPATT